MRDTLVFDIGVAMRSGQQRPFVDQGGAAQAPGDVIKLGPDHHDRAHVGVFRIRFTIHDRTGG